MSHKNSSLGRYAVWLTKPHMWSLAAAFIVGAALRFRGAGRLILLDDEFHALGAARTMPFTALFTHFAGADHCIPLAMAYKVLIFWTGLSEWSMRMPMLVSALLFCAIVPILVYPAVRTSALGWLIAIAPFHIFYSRYARPYAIALLLGLVSVLSLWRAIRSCDRRWLYAAVPCAILAPWLNLSFLAPIAAAGAAVSAWAFTARGRPMRAAWFASFGAMLSGWVLLLAPPLLVDSAALSAKAGTGLPTASTLIRAIQLVTGVYDPRICILLVLAAAFGLLVLLRREPWLGLLLTLAGGAQFSVARLIHPNNIVDGAVFARYTLFLFALYLIALACAVARAVEACTGRLRIPAVVLLALLCLGLFLRGPLPRLMRMPPEWLNHCAFQYSYDWAADGDLTLCPGAVFPGGFPPFYAAMRKLPPGSVTLLEAPWQYSFWLNPLPFYQLYHRQNTAIAFVEEVAGHPRDGELQMDRVNGRFRNFEQLGSAEFNSSVRADFLVIHKSWPAEQPGIASLRGKEEDMGRVISFCSEAFGRPSYEDSMLAVFPLTAKARALPAGL